MSYGNLRYSIEMFWKNSNTKLLDRDYVKNIMKSFGKISGIHSDFPYDPEEERETFFNHLISGALYTIWRTHTKELKELAELYPDITFVLDVRDDDWTVRFKEVFTGENYKKLSCKLVFEECK